MLDFRSSHYKRSIIKNKDDLSAADNGHSFNTVPKFRNFRKILLFRIFSEKEKEFRNNLKSNRKRNYFGIFRKIPENIEIPKNNKANPSCIQSASHSDNDGMKIADTDKQIRAFVGIREAPVASSPGYGYGVNL